MAKIHVVVMLFLSGCFFLIRLGMASHLIRLALKCSDGNASECNHYDKQANAVTNSFASVVVVTTTAGLGAVVTVMGNGWLWSNKQKSNWSARVSIPVMVLVWCLDAVAMGFAVKQFAVHDDPSSSTLAGSLAILTYIQILLSTILLVQLHQNQLPEADTTLLGPSFPVAAANLGRILEPICLLNLILFCSRLALAGAISNDSQNCISSNNLSSKHCTVLAANTNDVTGLLVGQTLWAGMVGIAACTLSMFVHFPQTLSFSKHNTQKSSTLAFAPECVVAVALISLMLDLPTMGYAVKQFAINYPNTNDSHIPSNSATSLLGFLSVFQPLLVHLPLLLALLSLCSFDRSSSFSSSRNTAAKIILVLSVVFHVFRICVAARIIDNILECRASSYSTGSKCSNSQSDMVNFSTPRLAEMSVLSGVVGVGASCVLAVMSGRLVWAGPVLLAGAINLAWVLLCVGLAIQQLDLKFSSLGADSLGHALAALALVQVVLDIAGLIAHPTPRDSDHDARGMEMQ
eukprot:c11135_g1_i2.p1 GENE.c11135_g1_i2~~c11135_g1_i2.p1  ORF type:complete len:530 (+),score=155.16 c11135_g1_i2:42-1592(+)